MASDDMTRIILIRENERRAWARYVRFASSKKTKREVVEVARKRWQQIVVIRRTVEIRGER